MIQEEALNNVPSRPPKRTQFGTAKVRQSMGSLLAVIAASLEDLRPETGEAIVPAESIASKLTAASASIPKTCLSSIGVFDGWWMVGLFDSVAKLSQKARLT